MTTVLTDDEAVAIAVTRRGMWPSPLSTVDLGSSTSFRQSWVRGARTLIARGLATAGAPAGVPSPRRAGDDPPPSRDEVPRLTLGPELAALGEFILGVTPVAAYVVRDEGDADAHGAGIFLYPHITTDPMRAPEPGSHQADIVMEVVVGDGVRELSTTTGVAGLEVFLATARGVFAMGVTGRDGGPSALCITARLRPGSSALMVSEGIALPGVLTVGPGGRVRFAPGQPTMCWDDDLVRSVIAPRLPGAAIDPDAYLPHAVAHDAP